MMIIMFISTMFFFTTTLISTISIMISKKMKMNYEKMSPFESGFNPMFSNRMPFSMRFFMISVIFLIFDVEIALIMPMLITLNISNPLNWMFMMLSFLMILIFGLFYEWKKGALNWL